MKVMGGTGQIVENMQRDAKSSALNDEYCIDDLAANLMNLPFSMIGDTLTLPWTVRETKRRAIEDQKLLE